MGGGKNEMLHVSPGRGLFSVFPVRHRGLMKWRLGAAGGGRWGGARNRHKNRAQEALGKERHCRWAGRAGTAAQGVEKAGAHCWPRRHAHGDRGQPAARQDITPSPRVRPLRGWCS